MKEPACRRREQGRKCKGDFNFSDMTSSIALKLFSGTNEQVLLTFLYDNRYCR